MEYLRDAHYFQLPSQGNIYTISHLQLINGTNKIIIATLKREVFCFEYQETNTGALKPTLKEISFTYIPSGAEIIALDVFNKSKDKNDFVIGIAIIKSNVEANSIESFLNIYSDWEETNEFNLESMAQNCFNIELNFIPYHLSHTYLVMWDDDNDFSKETIILQTGSDSLIHFYKENKPTLGYKEVDVKEHFPELYKPPSIVMWIDMYFYNNYSERLTAFGCECGYLRVIKVNVKTKAITLNMSTKFINQISCVKIYPEKPNIQLPPDLLAIKQINTIEEDFILNVVCVNSILPSVLFRDVLNYGITKYDTLKRLDTTSVLSCCEVADIDFNGYKEILIGSSAEEITMYKFNPSTGFHFEKERRVVSPVLGMKHIDITGDGVRELIVITMKGVYIFQYDQKFVREALRKKIEHLTIPDIDKLEIKSTPKQDLLL